MSTKKVLRLETEGKVEPELLELRALGDALANICLAGDRANLLDGTPTNLGLMIARKAAAIGATLGVL